MTLWKKATRPVHPMQKLEPVPGKPIIKEVTPLAAIAGGELFIRGSSLTANGRVRPLVRFGDRPASLLMSSSDRLVVRVPEGAVSGELTVDTGSAVSSPIAISVGVCLAENLHPVANPAVDAAGNVFTTFSGSRGQKTPVSVYKVDREGQVHPFLSGLMNPTGLAFDHDGLLYISSRMEGRIYQVTPHGDSMTYAEGMGIATGIAFDKEENLYVGDRSGTIFKINRERQIFVFATLEPSVAAYHLAFSPDGLLYVTGPTTSSFDHIYRISPAGEVSSFYRGLGRPQGLLYDGQGNVYVAASLGGRRGVVRITPEGKADLVISGQSIVGLAFTPRHTLALASNAALYEIKTQIEGVQLPAGREAD